MNKIWAPISNYLFGQKSRSDICSAIKALTCSDLDFLTFVDILQCFSGSKEDYTQLCCYLLDNIGSFEFDGVAGKTLLCLRKYGIDYQVLRPYCHKAVHRLRTINKVQATCLFQFLFVYDFLPGYQIINVPAVETIMANDLKKIFMGIARHNRCFYSLSTLFEHPGFKAFYQTQRWWSEATRDSKTSFNTLLQSLGSNDLPLNLTKLDVNNQLIDLSWLPKNNTCLANTYADYRFKDQDIQRFLKVCTNYLDSLFHEAQTTNTLENTQKK